MPSSARIFALDAPRNGPASGAAQPTLAALVTLLALATGGCSHDAPAGADRTPPALALNVAVGPVAKAAPVREVAAPTVPAPTPLPSLEGKIVLHVGDSMVGGHGGLSKALEERFTREGATLIRDTKVSESIVSFDKSTRLKSLLAKHKPDIVILTLGANDALVPYPHVMAGNVESIVKRVGDRACYWIGPPMWKPDTGIVNVIREHAGDCKFYDSSPLKLERSGDGIHPTDRGGAAWAEGFWTFFRGAPDAPVKAASAPGIVTL